MKVSIKKAAQELGVHEATLRRWEAAGKIQVERTPKGHRRYLLSSLTIIKANPHLIPWLRLTGDNFGGIHQDALDLSLSIILRTISK